MKFTKTYGVVFALMVTLAVGLPVQAYDLPSVNLGATSFLDGGPPAGPGLYFSQYIQYWTSDEFKDSNGDRLLPASMQMKILKPGSVCPSSSTSPIKRCSLGVNGD